MKFMPMSFRTKILRNFVLPIGDLAFGQRMISRLKFLEKTQYRPQEEILNRQQEYLHKLLQIAYTEVPFYQDLFVEAGVKPGDIQNAIDLSKLPVVTKEMLRAGYPIRTVRPTGQKTYESSTSGSTGKNFFVIEDAYTAGWYRSSFMLSLEWSGWNVGDPHLQTGMTLFRSMDRKLKDKILGCHYFSAYNLDDSHLDEILEEIDHHELKNIWGYPGSLYYLAKRAQEVGWNQPLRAAVTWGDTLFPHYRSLIESVFKTQVYDTYGCAEGIQIAAQCEYGNYHLHALDAVVEFLDDQGQPVRPGDLGNIVVTRLHPGPMPLIRYAIGDMGVPSDEKSCPCGRGFPLMQSIQGRNADVVTTPSGNRLIVHFFTGIMEHFTEVDSFQVVQTHPDQMIIKILPRSEPSESLTSRVVSAIHQKGAEDMKIMVEYVDEIPLPPSGKHRFVISEIKNQEGEVA